MIRPFISILFLAYFGCTQMAAQASFRVAFYNVENLFDTLDDPNNPRDNEFTPSGRLNWTPERYQQKLDNIEQVIATLNYPAILGLSEVENRKVLNDLTQHKGMATQNYGIVHIESPDYRGIDVALLYDSTLFTVTRIDTIRFTIPKEIVEEYTGRDILEVEAVYQQTDTLLFFVNHWPSRSGGLQKTEGRRLYTAAKLRARLNQRLANQPKRKVILMGDFNDEPDNASVASILGILPKGSTPMDGLFYNCLTDLDRQKQGSYNYRGNWNMIDQIMSSAALIRTDAPLKIVKAGVLKEDFMLYKDPKFGKRPSRTYGGPNYYGGYSDHLPVYIDLAKE